MAAYEAGWTMFEERPILGWGSSRVQTELADRIDGFHGNTFAVHNTYFEILLAYGLVGVALYLWLVLSLVRLGRKTAALKHEETEACGGFLAGSRGRTLWLLLLVAYFANATFVVMNYQFVNGLLFDCRDRFLSESGSSGPDESGMEGELVRGSMESLKRARKNQCWLRQETDSGANRRLYCEPVPEPS
jgi:hypothetical protein